MRTPWGIQGLAHNRAKLTKIGGVPLFRSICVLFVLPRVSNEQVSSKQRGPVSPNINKRPPSRSLFWSIWGPLPLLDPCYGQYTMLTNYHGPVSPNINKRPPSRALFRSIWDSLTLLGPCFGQFTMLENIHRLLIAIIRFMSPGMVNLLCIWCCNVNCQQYQPPTAQLSPIHDVWESESHLYRQCWFRLTVPHEINIYRFVLFTGPRLWSQL